MPFLHAAARPVVVATLLSLAWAGPSRPLSADEKTRQRVTQECTVEATGDIRLVHTVKLPLRAYTALKDEVRNTALLLRRLGVEGQATIFREARAEYDDAESAVRVTARMVGVAKSRGAVWHVPIVNAAEQEVLEQAPDRIRLLAIATLGDRTEQVVTTSLVFPAGTRRVRFDAKAGRVEAEMPPPPSKPGARAALHMDLQSRPELMSCFHKLYGLPEFSTLWVARAAFVNQGEGAAKDLGVRFRIPGFSDWSPWETSGWAHPGQTVVEAYYPILSRAVLDLTAETPAQVEVEWRARDADGAALTGQETRPLTLLGMNDVIWSSMPSEQTTSWAELFDNSPLVAGTFVSHTDPVVQRFAGMAAALSGGVAASHDDASAKRYMRAVYELMAANRIAYQSPPGILKDNPRQHVKYARDVLRNRAGTCIDLAILFASTCQAGGLAPLMVFVPGHAFPAVRLPSGEIQPLESTAISVHPTGRALPFEEALARGEKNLEHALERGLYMLCDIKALRVRGIPPPELPALAGDPLADWGIEQKGLGATGPPPTGPGPTGAPSGASRWRHPSGAFSLAPPKGWQVKAVEGGADLQSHDRNVRGSVRMRAREGIRSARSLAEELGLSIVQGESGRALQRRVRSHGEGQTGDKRHPRSSVQCATVDDGRAFLEDFHVSLGRQNGYVLYVRWPENQSEGWLPALRELVASFVIHEEPAEPSPPEIHRQLPDGACTFEIPAGWSAAADGEGGVRLTFDEGAASIAVNARMRAPQVRTAEQQADALLERLTREQEAQGAKVEVLNRTKATGGGGKFPSASVFLRVTSPEGVKRKHQLVGLASARRMTTVLLEAPDELWDLWIPSFNQVFRTLKIDDQPPTDADAPASQPPTKPKPDPRPVAPVRAPLEPYEDPAGLFRMQVPKGWKVEGLPLGVNATSLKGDAVVSLTLGEREGEDHDTFVARVLERMTTSFSGWKEQGRAVGGGEDERATRLDSTAVVDGTPVHMLVDLTTTPHFHQLLLLVCPLAQRAAYEPLWTSVLAEYGRVTGAWPDERPLLRLRSVAPERLPYTLEVPSNWRVEPQGLDVVAKSVHGDALVVARATPKAHESIDALGAALLARMQSRGRSVQVLSQEVREEDGRSVLVARIRDELNGEPWERELRATQTATHDLQLVVASRADVRFKWDALLARIAASWRPRP